MQQRFLSRYPLFGLLGHHQPSLHPFPGLPGVSVVTVLEQMMAASLFWSGCFNKRP